jgi:hypothetical protein
MTWLEIDALGGAPGVHSAVSPTGTGRPEHLCPETLEAFRNRIACLYAPFFPTKGASEDHRRVAAGFGEPAARVRL